MRIYIADDNEEFSNVVRRVAEGEGWEATTCLDGRELAAAVSMAHDPALLIIDINMPNIDGIEAIDRLKSIQRRMRIRFVTGGPDTSALAARMIAEARGLEVGRFLTKPVGIDTLKEILRQEAEVLYREGHS